MKQREYNNEDTKEDIIMKKIMRIQMRRIRKGIMKEEDYEDTNEENKEYDYDGTRK